MSTRRNLVMGALVADAASLGLHWLYDQDRIVGLGGDTPEFCATEAGDYEGVPSYFAHPLKQPGDLTQYGEQLLVLLRVLADTNGTYDQKAYNTAFAGHFGYGGTYVGYIDHAIRGTLNNLAGTEMDAPQGTTDVQLPAISKLPALVAAGLESHAPDAVRSTNISEAADLYGAVATAMLVAARDGGSAQEIADAALATADPSIRPRLDLACTSPTRSTPDFTAELGLACDLEMGVPSVLHTLLTARSYKHAIRANILAGGDSCGRAILLGALTGVLYGVPEDWSARVNAMPSANAQLDQLGL